MLRLGQSPMEVPVDLEVGSRAADEARRRRARASARFRLRRKEKEGNLSRTVSALKDELRVSREKELEQTHAISMLENEVRVGREKSDLHRNTSLNAAKAAAGTPSIEAQ